MNPISFSFQKGKLISRSVAVHLEIQEIFPLLGGKNRENLELLNTQYVVDNNNGKHLSSSVKVSFSVYLYVNLVYGVFKITGITSECGSLFLFLAD